ncbi:MAG: hypothetical protein KDA36_08850 [Planctomycetaceae bacterium]|nr:hypothetical protein [Planctomycetaceae bacterium]
MSTATVLPNGDGTTTNWQDDSGGTTNLYTRIDEGTASPNDTDYVSTSVQNQNVYFQLGDMPADFGTATGVTIKLRVARTSSKGDFIQFVNCQLMQNDQTTAICAASTITDSTTITTYSYTPSITGATSKTAWDGMRLRVKSGTGTAGSCRIYSAQVEVTYTAVSGKIQRVTALDGLGGVGIRLVNPGLW